MPKLNRTISRWSSGVGEVGYDVDTTSERSQWSGGSSLGDVLDRVTTVGGWCKPVALLPEVFHEPVVAWPSFDCERLRNTGPYCDKGGKFFPMSLLDHYSTNAVVGGLKGGWYVGDGLAEGTELLQLYAQAASPISLDVVQHRTSLRVERFQFYRVKVNRGVIVVKGHGILVVDNNLGLIVVDNCHNAVRIVEGSGRIMRRDEEHLDDICLDCLQFTSRCGHFNHAV